VNTDPTAHPEARDALRALRSFSGGLLLIGGIHWPRRFVLDPPSGRPVMPMPADWEPADTANPEDSGAVLYLPDDTDPELQLVIEPAPIDPRTHEAADRWAAYHGEARERVWSMFKVESVRWRGEVFDGDDVLAGNPLRAAEGRLLRGLNADRARLGRVCERATGVRPEAPMAVGVDPDGIDARASLGVMRIEFPSDCADEAAARSAIAALAGDSAP